MGAERVPLDKDGEQASLRRCKMRMSQPCKVDFRYVCLPSFGKLGD